MELFILLEYSYILHVTIFCSNIFRIGRIKHERVKVPRGDKILDWAVNVLKLHSNRKSILEVSSVLFISWSDRGVYIPIQSNFIPPPPLISFPNFCMSQLPGISRVATLRRFNQDTRSYVGIINKSVCWRIGFLQIFKVAFERLLQVRLSKGK